MNRRNFTKTCGKLCLTGFWGTTFLSSCQTTSRISSSFQDNKIVVKKIDCVDKTSVIVETDKAPAAIFLNLKNENNYFALLMQCTHLQCDIVVSGNIFHCPCHGSEFSSTGEVLESPATEPLYQYKVTTDSENIYIHIN